MVKAHFTNIRAEIITELKFAQHSIKIAVAWFTNLELFDCILEKCEQGIHIELIIVKDAINLRKYGLDFNKFIELGGKLFFGNSDSLMHHKFCVIDDSILLNGSYNWTYWAESKNSENITVIQNDDALLCQFLKEFIKIKHDLIPETEASYIELPEKQLNPLLSSQDLLVNEYLQSAIIVSEKGNDELAEKIITQVSRIKPLEVTKYLTNGIAANNSSVRNLYSIVSNSNSSLTTYSYANYCYQVSRFIQQQDYFAALKLANECIKTYKTYKGFSIHVYRGDLKMKFADETCAFEDYQSAIKILDLIKPPLKLLYYNREFSYFFQPRIDIFLKLGQIEDAKNELKEAIKLFTKMNKSKWVEFAEEWLKKISS